MDWGQMMVNWFGEDWETVGWVMVQIGLVNTCGDVECK